MLWPGDGTAAAPPVALFRLIGLTTLHSRTEPTGHPAIPAQAGTHGSNY